MDIIGYPLDHLQVFFSCSFTHHPHRATLLALLFTAGAHGTATVGKKKAAAPGPEAPRGGWCICGAYLTQPKLAAFSVSPL